MDILVVSALFWEIEPLISKYKAAVKNVSHVKLYVSTIKDYNLFFMSTGVGKKNVIKRLPKILDYFKDIKNMKIYFIGLAGGLDLRVGDLIYPNKFLDINLKDSIEIDSNFEDEKTMLTVDRVYGRKEKLKVLNVNAIDMEAYHVLNLTKDKKILTKVVKVISDDIDFVFPRFDLIPSVINSKPMGKKFIDVMRKKPSIKDLGRVYKLYCNCMKARKKLVKEIEKKIRKQCFALDSQSSLE